MNREEFLATAQSADLIGTSGDAYETYLLLLKNRPDEAWQNILGSGYREAVAFASGVLEARGIIDARSALRGDWEQHGVKNTVTRLFGGRYAQRLAEGQTPLPADLWAEIFGETITGDPLPAFV